MDKLVLYTGASISLTLFLFGLVWAEMDNNDLIIVNEEKIKTIEKKIDRIDTNVDELRDYLITNPRR